MALMNFENTLALCLRKQSLAMRCWFLTGQGKPIPAPEKNILSMSAELPKICCKDGSGHHFWEEFWCTLILGLSAVFGPFHVVQGGFGTHGSSVYEM